ncbi:MAG: hypothetical protein JO347_04110 [Candidatus Eremiobacteraeota bacterium]|nr:hypothetical protein [Candidatus Eremiobacteraeota bacterium]MBV8281232.1 hypothetical protein [Candidatus Eremiobacteraeota bacterium]
MRSTLFALGLIGACAAPASAHPLGNFTINHLTKANVNARSIVMKYVLDIAEIPTFQIMRERGIQGAQRDADLERWARDEAGVVAGGLHVSANGAPLRLVPGVARASTRPGAGGLPTLYWVDEFRAALPAAASPRRIEIRDAVYPEKIGWRDVVVAPEREPTNELRSYPSAVLGSPRHIAGVLLTLDARGRTLSRVALEGSDEAPAGSSSQLRSNTLADMLAKGAADPWVVLLTLCMAAGLGALHALEPGHGKTLLAVSLVGARATATQALILATGLTFAHTAGVLALGLLLLGAAQWIVPEHVYPWITLASGLMVAALGASALARYMRARRGEGHAHGHHHAHDSDDDAGTHAHAHGSEGHTHVPPGTAPLTFRSVLLIAMSGNIAPCPAALVVLLTALTLHRVGYGLLVIVAFSVGLAAVLTGLGVALVRGAAWLSDRPRFAAVVRYGPLVSAAVIACVGAAMIGQGASASMLHMPSFAVTALALAAIAGYASAPGHTHAHRHAPLLDRGVS